MRRSRKNRCRVTAPRPTSRCSNSSFARLLDRAADPNARGDEGYGGSSRTHPRSTQGGMRLPPSEAAPARRPGHNVTQLTALQQAIDDAVAVTRGVSDQVLAALDTT